MIRNRVKERLAAGELVVGCFVRSPDATFAEYVAQAGWDFLVLDGEHGSIDVRDVADLARACEVRDVTPIVRVPTVDQGIVLRCVDAGAAGLHFPWIDDADAARRAVGAVKYPPLGRRGLAGNRSTDWTVNAKATAHANQQTLVVVQVETREAVDRIDELCAVEGVDVVFIGPSDLSQSFGVPGEVSHPTVRDAIQRVAEAVGRSGKALGLFASTSQAATEGIELGARYVATGVEALLGSVMRSFLDQTRSESPPSGQTGDGDASR